MGIYSLFYCVSGIDVFLCEFHREQAWCRWISAGKNGISQNEADVLGLKEKLQRIAHAQSLAVNLKEALDDLKESQIYEKQRIRNWFEKKHGNHKLR